MCNRFILKKLNYKKDNAQASHWHCVVFEFIKVFLITFHTLYGFWEKLSSFYFNAIWEHYSVIAFFITDIDPYCKWRWECRISISNRHFIYKQFFRFIPYPFFSNQLNVFRGMFFYWQMVWEWCVENREKCQFRLEVWIYLSKE